MKASDFRNKDDAELKGQLEELAAEHLKLRFQKATAQITNTARISQVKRDIARIQTVMSERCG
ncbi:MAG: 50S ribosomal protein L29 [Mariprofundaceae bacterium]|nr:50S ribosomal protein L29 [Mariprofundaceae bacterium]